MGRDDPLRVPVDVHHPEVADVFSPGEVEELSVSVTQRTEMSGPPHEVGELALGLAPERLLVEVAPSVPQGDVYGRPIFAPGINISGDTLGIA